MSEFKTSRCKGCDREIIWAVNPATGKKVPLDAKPVPHYYLTLTDDGPEAIKEETTTFISHFLTCPKAADFSRSKKP